MKLLQQHDHQRPWRMALVRKAALAPLEAVSTFFRTYLKTWWDCFAPQSPQGKEKK